LRSAHAREAAPARPRAGVFPGAVELLEPNWPAWRPVSTRLLSRDRSDDRPHISRRSPFRRRFLVDDALIGCADVRRRFSMGAGWLNLFCRSA